MTYFGFHLRFNLPVLVLLALLPGGADFSGGRWVAGLVVLAAVYVFTIPWDNYAAWRGTWGFAAGRHWRKVGYLPPEEYLFFGVQSVQSMMAVNVLARLLPGRETLAGPGPFTPGVGVVLLLLCGVWLAVGLRWGRVVTWRHRWHYGWHLLFWFVPVVAMQWVIGWNILLPRLDFLLWPTVVLGTWLCFADWRAIFAGLWFFDEGQITGWKLRGVMPWEEIAFFYLTTLLVCQSYLILLPEAAR